LGPTGVLKQSAGEAETWGYGRRYGGQIGREVSGRASWREIWRPFEILSRMQEAAEDG